MERTRQDEGDVESGIRDVGTVRKLEDVNDVVFVAFRHRLFVIHISMQKHMCNYELLRKIIDGGTQKNVSGAESRTRLTSVKAMDANLNKY